MISLDTIREKVVAGERLTFDDGMFLYQPETPLNDRGCLGEYRSGAEKRQRRVLQHQHAFESHECLFVSLHLLRVSV